MKAKAILVVALAAAAMGCNSDPSAGQNEIAVTSNQFTPTALTVPISTSVVWSWQNGTHDVTFEDGTGDSARNKSSGTHSRTFGAAGTFRYRCTIHSANFTSGMVGTVTVQ